jgi:hypothetical protein
VRHEQEADNIYSDARITSQDMLLGCQRLTNRCRGDKELSAALNVVTQALTVLTRLAADKLIVERKWGREKAKGVSTE